MRAPAGGSTRCGKHAPFAGHRLASAHHVGTCARPTGGDQRGRGRRGGRRRRHPPAAPARAPAGRAAAVRAGLAAGRGGPAAGHRRPAAGAGACRERYVVGAFAGTRMVGANAGFFSAPPDPALHSHITGVAPGGQHREGRVRAQGPSTGVGAGPRGPGDHLDLRPAGGPQRLVQPGQAGRAAHRLPGGLLRAHDRRHQRRDGQRPAAPDLDAGRPRGRRRLRRPTPPARAGPSRRRGRGGRGRRDRPGAGDARDRRARGHRRGAARRGGAGPRAAPRLAGGGPPALGGRLAAEAAVTGFLRHPDRYLVQRAAAGSEPR